MGKLFINDREVEFYENETILNVAKRNNIYIPALCYLEEITPTGACRLCLVTVEGIDKPLPACNTYAQENLKVYTDTPDVIKYRNKALEFVLMKHPLDCPVCDKAGYCLLQDITYTLGINSESFGSLKPAKEIQEWNLIIYNPNLCILCERCTKLCHSVEGSFALKLRQGAFDSGIEPVFPPLECDFCGLCVDYCPVGALLDRPFHHIKRVWDVTFKNQVCVLCPVGCDIEYGVFENKIIQTKKADSSYMCGLGRYAFNYLYNEKRLEKCLIKKNNNIELVDLEKAFTEISLNIENIVGRYGNKSIAFIAGSRLSNEAIWAIKKLATGIGTEKVITDIAFYDRGFFKQYKEVFGTYESVGTLRDIGFSDLIFVIGADLSRELIGLKWQIIKSVVEKESKLINIGLKTYDFDYLADHCILADYADFADIFNKIINSKDHIYSDIREKIKSAKNISIIVGTEFISYEKDFNSLFDFLDFLNIKKIKAFIPALNKGNFRGLLESGLYDNNYSPEKFLEDIKSGSIKCLIWADFYPYSFLPLMDEIKKNINMIEYKISLDLFVNDFNKDANIILPVLSNFEKQESFTLIDGRLIRTNLIVEPVSGIHSDVFYIEKIAEIFNIKIPLDSLFPDMVKELNVVINVLNDLDNNTVFIPKMFTYNRCHYKYKEMEKNGRDIYINDRYHNGLLTTFAVYVNDNNSYKLTYLDNCIEDPDTLKERYTFAKGLHIKMKSYK